MKLTALFGKQASEDPDDPGLIHRGLSVVLPKHIHDFVHDENQPAGARAHMLLAHVRKAKPEITSEEAKGTTGGLGNYWSPRKEKAAEYGDQGGWGAYKNHEREHGCGDEDTGYGGCKSTHVVIHAGTPPEKSHWTENFRDGEKYDPEVSWRLPVRPDAKLMVHGISWKQGHDSESGVHRDFVKENAEPYSRYDFLRPVKKQAASHDGPQHHTFAEPITRRAMATDWDKHYPEVTAVHRGLGVSLPKALHAYVHDESQPRAARAAALLEHVQKRPFGKHWSADPDIGKSFATQYARKDPDEPDTQATPVVIHARVPARESIQTDLKILKKHRIKDFDKDYYGNHEMEVPLKRGAPLHVSAISWANPDSYRESSGQHRFARHYFDEPVQHKAGANGDLPEGLSFRHETHLDGRLHHLIAEHPDAPHQEQWGNHVGRITWWKGDGEVANLSVEPQYQRRGVATELWNRAKGIQPDLKHSEDQTEEGSAWAHTTAAYVPPGTMGTDSQGHGVQMTTMDGWAHRDGSHGHEHGPDVGERPVYTKDHTWLPNGRYWGPNSAQNDQRLFDGDHLRPEVRQDILDRVGGVLDKYEGWKKWARVYFAGSEAAQWRPFNGDFDVLITVDMDAFWDDNHRLEELTGAEVATMLTEELWTKANVSDYFFTLKDGRRVGPFDRTFFVITAPDIRDIHPYAAYDVTDDDWAVHPLQVPKSWSAQSLPESYWGYAESLVHEIEAIGQLPAEERHRMAANLYEELHTHRSDAFADGGHGLFDLSNVTEKYLDQHPDKPWAKLVQWKNDSPSGPEPWVPTTARRTTLTSLFASSPEICPKCGLSSRDHEEGYAEYGDCPFEEHITDWSRHERTMPETMHRGVHTTLPPDLHSLVHDTRRSTDERAQALRDHVDNFFGAASNRSAMHWTTRPEMAEEFAEGSHNGSRDSDQHTHVIFHAKSPTDFGPSGPVEIDPWALTHHGVFPYSPDHEAEIPLKRGAGIHLTGVSWRKGGGAGEWTHHEYAEPQIAKLAADGADYGGVMIAIVPPEKICKELAQDGGEPVEAMHVTLAYMPGQDRRKAARELPELVEGWARTQKALKGHVGGVGTFVNPGQHVLWAAVDIPHGGPFRQSLVEVLERHGYDVANDHGWTPHLTLAYRDHHVRFLPKIEPASWDITEVHICVGDDWTAVPLG